MIDMGQKNFVELSDPMVVGTKADRDRAKRLARLREAMGYRTQRQFATKFLRVEYARYNNAERGHPLGRQLADIIVSKCPGVTGDWLYYGIPDGLSFRMATALGESPIGAGKGKISPD